MNRTYDEAKGVFGEALAAGRTTNWFAGDVLNEQLDEARRDCPSPRIFTRRKRAILGDFAAVGHCKRAMAGQLAMIAAAFPAEDDRLPDLSFAFYVEVCRAAQHTGREVLELFTTARDKGWHVKELKALGRNPAAQAVGLTATCDACGTAIRLRNKSTKAYAYQQLSIVCPVCVAQAKREGADQDEPIVGAMEKAA
jgi:hypothetical protein